MTTNPGRIPLYILVDGSSSFRETLPHILQEIYVEVSSTHHILRHHDKDRNPASHHSSLARFENQHLYLNSSTQHAVSDALSQESIFSPSNALTRVGCDGYIAWGNGQVLFENLLTYSGRMHIVIVLLSEEAKEEWKKILNKELKKYSADVPTTGTKSKKRLKKGSKQAPELVEREVTASDYEIVDLGYNLGEICEGDSRQVKKEIAEKLLWVILPDLMIKKQQEATVRGDYLDSYRNKSKSGESGLLSAEEYARKEIYPHLLPLLREVSEVVRSKQEGRELDEVEESIAAKPLLHLSQQLRALSEKHHLQ